MGIFVFSDESGTFDFIHNEYFLFGGLIFRNKTEREVAARKYMHVERCIREEPEYQDSAELKACCVSNKVKAKIFRSLNNEIKFVAVLDQRKINPRVFASKRHKQRYLDYAYKIVLKRCLSALIDKGLIDPKNIDMVHVFADEHTTSTNGVYELREALLNEFKYGTFNSDYHCYFEPIFPNVANVTVTFCHSQDECLIRASDIIANHYYHEVYERAGTIEGRDGLFCLYLPSGECVSGFVDVAATNPN